MSTLKTVPWKKGFVVIGDLEITATANMLHSLQKFSDVGLVNMAVMQYAKNFDVIH